MCVSLTSHRQHPLILRPRIILYVITGCVSALFIIVIVSGVRFVSGFIASRLMMSTRLSEHSGTLNDTGLGVSIQPIPKMACILKVVPRV